MSPATAPPVLSAASPVLTVAGLQVGFLLGGSVLVETIFSWPGLGQLIFQAIVARDFGIPAVACPGATRLLQDGDSVRVDGNQGQVAVLGRATRHA